MAFLKMVCLISKRMTVNYMFSISVLLAFGGGSKSLDKTPMGELIAILAVVSIFIYYLFFKRGKSD